MKWDFKKDRLQTFNQLDIKIVMKWITIIVEGFDPAINYGPNDAGISAITIILGIISLIVISLLFGKIYGQVAKIFENNNKKDR